jgi:hypothetical protein
MEEQRLVARKLLKPLLARVPRGNVVSSQDVLIGSTNTVIHYYSPGLLRNASRLSGLIGPLRHRICTCWPPRAVRASTLRPRLLEKETNDA